jgi:hypothetical protein
VPGGAVVDGPGGLVDPEGGDEVEGGEVDGIVVDVWPVGPLVEITGVDLPCSASTAPIPAAVEAIAAMARLIATEDRSRARAATGGWRSVLWSWQ